MSQKPNLPTDTGSTETAVLGSKYLNADGQKQTDFISPVLKERLDKTRQAQVKQNQELVNLTTKGFETVQTELTGLKQINGIMEERFEIIDKYFKTIARVVILTLAVSALAVVGLSALGAYVVFWFSN